MGVTRLDCWDPTSWQLGPGCGKSRPSSPRPVGRVTAGRTPPGTHGSRTKDGDAPAVESPQTPWARHGLHPQDAAGSLCLEVSRRCYRRLQTTARASCRAQGHTCPLHRTGVPSSTWVPLVGTEASSREPLGPVSNRKGGHRERSVPGGGRDGAACSPGPRPSAGKDADTRGLRLACPGPALLTHADVVSTARATAPSLPAPCRPPLHRHTRPQEVSLVPLLG